LQITHAAINSPLFVRRSAPLSEPIHSLHVIFCGTVQGVGFRYAAQQLASVYPKITGVVRNLPDGSVELTAEGSKCDIEAYLSDIQDRMRYYISDISAVWGVTNERHAGFSIAL
jgi:acylphosphatase